MHKSGDVILVHVQFADSSEMKLRPAAVLFEDFGNIVIAGITSNLKMKGIKLTQEDGAIKESVIKTNYIFTVSEVMVKKNLFALSKIKRKQLLDELTDKLDQLIR